MAAQDVQGAGRGVTIVDPHGDLVDHVLRSIPDGRVEEVVLIDLSRADALPVINPLDINRFDPIRRDSDNSGADPSHSVTSVSRKYWASI